MTEKQGKCDQDVENVSCLPRVFFFVYRCRLIHDLVKPSFTNLVLFFVFYAVSVSVIVLLFVSKIKCIIAIHTTSPYSMCQIKFTEINQGFFLYFCKQAKIPCKCFRYNKSSLFVVNSPAKYIKNAVFSHQQKQQLRDGMKEIILKNHIIIQSFMINISTGHINVKII